MTWRYLVNLDRLYKALHKILVFIPSGPEKDELVDAILELGIPRSESQCPACHGKGLQSDGRLCMMCGGGGK